MKVRIIIHLLALLAMSMVGQSTATAASDNNAAASTPDVNGIGSIHGDGGAEAGDLASLADLGGQLLVVETGRVSRLTQAGDLQAIGKTYSTARMHNGKVYMCRGSGLGRYELVPYDLEGKRHRAVPIPREVRNMVDFIILPGGRFAFFDNKYDVVHFADISGRHIREVALPETASKGLQNMFGLVVGNSLIISEDGRGQLIAIDLTTYETSIFRDFSRLKGWLGALAYADGSFYLCQSRQVITFEEGSDVLKRIAITPDGYITGIVVENGRIFVSVNGVTHVKQRSLEARIRTRRGIIYEIDPNTGEVKKLLDGLRYPVGLLFAPAATE